MNVYIDNITFEWWCLPYMSELVPPPTLKETIKSVNVPSVETRLINNRRNIGRGSP